jgi:hypothetical protein
MKSPLGYQFRNQTIPDNTAYGLRQYIDHHIRPGSFLTAVLCNDLRESFSCADEENSDNLQSIVAWLYNEAPSAAWGNRERFVWWLNAGEDS